MSQNTKHNPPSSCPCADCRSERQHRAYLQSRLIRISPQSAYILGILPQLNPYGSYTRELKHKLGIQY